MQAVFRIDGLPSGALDAAAKFHQIWLPRIRESLSGDAESLALVLPSAPVDHRDWRRSVARDLARELAPKRVNLIAGDDADAIATTLGFLEHAQGVTGQLLPVDSNGAEIRAGRTDG